MKEKTKNYIILFIAFFLDSISIVCGKLASGYATMSFPFLVWYAADVFFLGVFAILWQQILKKMPLSVAYSSRPVVTILGVIYGVLFFKDQLSVLGIIGIVVIIAGIWMVSADE